MNFVSVSNNIIIHTSIAIINGMKHILNGKHKQPFEHLHNAHTSNRLNLLLHKLDMHLFMWHAFIRGCRRRRHRLHTPHSLINKNVSFVTFLRFEIFVAYC